MVISLGCFIYVRISLSLSLDAILTRKLGIFSFVRKLCSVSTERRNHDLYLRRSIVIGRSQNLHDCRINLSAIGVTVSVEFHLKGRTLSCRRCILYPGNFYIIRTFLSFHFLFRCSFIDILYLFVPALGSIVLRFVLFAVIAFVAKLFFPRDYFVQS